MTRKPDPRPVVVGVGMADNQNSLLDHAAAEAVRAGSYLRLVHAYSVPPSTIGELHGYDFAATYRAAGEELLARAAARVSAAHPRLRVRTALSRGVARTMLEKESRTAQLLVVGEDLDKAFMIRLYEGRVANQLARHSSCPVVIVPENWQEPSQDLKVVVVLDHAEPDRAVLNFATSEASILGCELTILHTDLHARCDRDTHESERLVTQSANASLVVMGQVPSVMSGAYRNPLDHVVVASAACPVAVVPRSRVFDQVGRASAVRPVASQPPRHNR